MPRLSFPALSLISLLLLVGSAKAAEPLRMPLWPDRSPVGNGAFEDATGSITVHLPPESEATGTAVVICPGGGYGGLVTGPEGQEIARWLNQQGVAGIVLEYRLPQGRHQVPLLDAQRAIRTVRHAATGWHIKPDQIGIMGFSAGGHLAATAATQFDQGNPAAIDPIEREGCRPDFALLIYPVVSMGQLTHGGSRQNLLGEAPPADLVKRYSAEEQVTAATPPMFLAHAVDDTAVVPENSRQLQAALKARGIDSEYVELAGGGHGLNGYKGPFWDEWQTKALVWLARRHLIPATSTPVP
jgi:acetyl esterase/lipase